MSVIRTQTVVSDFDVETQRVAFAGKMGSGKSYQAERCAKILRERYNHEVRILSLSTAIKEMAIGYNEFSGRSGYQMIGHIGRQIDAEVWIKHLCMELEKIPKDTSIFIDDVRYLNEVIALKKIGFKIVLVDTTFETRFFRIAERIKTKKQTFQFNEVAAWFSHNSERQFDNVLDRPSFDEVLTDDAIYADIHYKDASDEPL